MERKLNVQYSFIQGSYWMIYGAAVSYASVFLLAKDYTNSEIGVILAISNILAVIIQPFLADFADRTEKISMTAILEIVTALLMVLTVGTFVIERKSLALGFIFVMLIAWHTAVQPIVTALSFKLCESGVYINFGVARSIGSLAYSILVGLLGTLVEKFGTGIIPITNETAMVMLLLSLIITGRSYKKIKDKNIAAKKIKEPEEEEKINLVEFLKRNKMFFIVNLGVAGLFFSNAIFNNYLMQIVTAIGGNSSDMGKMLSISAFLEIPTMVLFDRLRRHFSCQLMLKVSAIGFTIKIGLCFLAKSVTLVFIAHLFQFMGFALFLPAMVNFTNEIMSKGESVKGQAFFTTMITLINIFASLSGGVILDTFGAKALTLIGTIVTFIGAVVIFLSVDRIKKES